MNYNTINNNSTSTSAVLNDDYNSFIYNDNGNSLSQSYKIQNFKIGETLQNGGSKNINNNVPDSSLTYAPNNRISDSLIKPNYILQQKGKDQVGGLRGTSSEKFN